MLQKSAREYVAEVEILARILQLIIQHEKYNSFYNITCIIIIMSAIYSKSRNILQAQFHQGDNV